MARQYAVVGGGIAGASIAYHLGTRTDDPVTLFERQSPASETTAKSVAQFGFYGDETQYRMKRYGMRLYNRFFADARANPAYNFMGVLVAATEAENAARLERVVDTGGDETIGKIGMGFDRDLLEYLGGDELHETLLLPELAADEIEGALFRPKVGYMTRPQELAYEFLERARENGVTVRSGTRVEEITTADGRVTGLVTDDGEEHAADEVVCAAGPWNVELARSVGVDIPVQHTIAPILKLEPPEPIEHTLPAVSHYESPFAFHRRTPEEFLVGYNPGYDTATEFDPDATSERVPTDIRDEATELLGRLLPSMLDAEVVDEWVGIRSVTPDGNPVVGWTELDGFSIAGFHTSGIQLAPAVGDVIARQLLDDDPTDYYDALSITRFDGYTDWRP
jgi:glycine/D-amino acid oxidase-like deaminating enzyme